MNYQNIFIGNAEIVTPFGQGLEINLRSLLDGKEAYGPFPKERFGANFPVSSAGFIPNEYYFEKNKHFSRNEFLFQRLLESLKRKNSRRKYDAIFLLYTNVEVFPVLPTSRPLNYLLDTDEESISKILLANEIEIDKKNIYIIDNTCTTGLTLMTLAAQGIAQNKWSDVLVCAIDLIGPHGAYLLEGLGAFARASDHGPAVSRPFDKRRNGFIKTESASIAIVSSDNSVLGDECLMKLRSFSQNNDGYKLTDGRDDTLYIKEAMDNALKNAEITCEDLAFIKAHGTATKLNDQHEAKAISELFPDQWKVIPITSLKGHLGHTTDASGLIENLIAADALKKGIILPTKNCEQLDFDLNIVRNPIREVKSKFFLSNSFGFGGNNASAVFEVM